MSIKIIENLETRSSDDFTNRVLDELMAESEVANDESMELFFLKELPHVIYFTTDFDITISLDCKNPNESIISYDNILASSYSDLDNFFDKISRLDKVSDNLRTLWQDFTSAVSNVKGGF